MSTLVAVLIASSGILLSNSTIKMSHMVTLDDTVAAEASHVCVVAGAFRLQQAGHVQVQWYDLAVSTAIPAAESWLDWHPNVLTLTRSCVPLEIFESPHVWVQIRDPTITGPGVPWPTLYGMRIQTEQHKLP